MLDLDDRLDELKQLGLYRRTRMVSGPQGPRVVLDGRPVLVLCSGNSLGLADHPRVREAAADAAMRWGVGAGAARMSSGTMTLHRRLEERLARFTGADAAVVFGSGLYRELSFESLVRHHAAIEKLVAEHEITAFAAYVGLYIVVVMLSIPGAMVLTVAGGVLFGTLLGALGAIAGATVGGTIIFLIARGAVGEILIRRAGPRLAKVAAGFRDDAFC